MWFFNFFFLSAFHAFYVLQQKIPQNQLQHLRSLFFVSPGIWQKTANHIWTVYVCYDSDMLELDQLVLFVRCRMLGAIVIFAPKAISIDFFIKHLHFSHNFLTFLKICRPSIKYMPFWRHISRLSPHQHVLQTSDFVDFIWNAECLSIIGTLKVDTDRSLILIDRDLVYFTTQVSDHATRIWHKWDMNDTSATRVWHECFTSDTSAARVKNFDFDNGTSENTSSQPYSNYMANERLQEEEQFHYKN